MTTPSRQHPCCPETGRIADLQPGGTQKSAQDSHLGLFRCFFIPSLLFISQRSPLLSSCTGNLSNLLARRVVNLHVLACFHFEQAFRHTEKPKAYIPCIALGIRQERTCMPILGGLGRPQASSIAVAFSACSKDSTYTGTANDCCATSRSHAYLLASSSSFFLLRRRVA